MIFAAVPVLFFLALATAKIESIPALERDGLPEPFFRWSKGDQR
ncbi:MAG: hypothetical protein OEU26_37620 [Candidatus Tectomicrobia bacterium]|nr:hypothetical protein [Candidatus Tectomicrobia bacterium]